MDWLLFGTVLVLAAGTSVLAWFVWSWVPARSRLTQQGILNSISRSIEVRTGQFGETRSIVHFCLEVADMLDLPSATRRSIERAAHVAQIGLVGVPYRTLRSSSKHEWTDEQNEAFEGHPTVGCTMLSFIPEFSDLVPIVSCQRARFDGVGSRFLPAGNDIPIESRILFAVQTYVSARRQYGESEARRVLREGSGSVFCPMVVDALLRVLKLTGVERAAEPAGVV